MRTGCLEGAQALRAAGTQRGHLACPLQALPKGHAHTCLLWSEEIAHGCRAVVLNLRWNQVHNRCRGSSVKLARSHLLDVCDFWYIRMSYESR